MYNRRREAQKIDTRWVELWRYQDEEQQEGGQDQSCEGVGDHRRGLFLRLPEQMLEKRRNRQRGESVKPWELQVGPKSLTLTPYTPATKNTAALCQRYLDLRFGNVECVGLDHGGRLLVHESQHHISLMVGDINKACW